MRVEYTLPGLLPEATPAAVTESGERPAEAFGAHLQHLRVPDITDWREVLRLNTASPGATHIEPPPAPKGMQARDGASLRAWRRSMLHKQAGLLESAPEADSGLDGDGRAAVQRMLALLSESQRREDEVFARHFAESGD